MLGHYFQSSATAACAFAMAAKIQRAWIWYGNLGYVMWAQWRWQWYQSLCHTGLLPLCLKLFWTGVLMSYVQGLRGRVHWTQFMWGEDKNCCLPFRPHTKFPLFCYWWQLHVLVWGMKKKKGPWPDFTWAYTAAGESLGSSCCQWTSFSKCRTRDNCTVFSTSLSPMKRYQKSFRGSCILYPTAL